MQSWVHLFIYLVVVNLNQNTDFQLKVKVVPYTFVRRGVPVREDTYPEPSECKVG